MSTTTILVPVEGAKLREAIQKRRTWLAATIADRNARVASLLAFTKGDWREEQEKAELDDALPVTPSKGTCYVDHQTASRLGLISKEE